MADAFIGSNRQVFLKIKFTEKLIIIFPGWCNNVAWNVGPMTANQMEMALTAHEWNRLNSYQSLVPMQHLCWSLARDVRFSNQKLYNQVKNMLIRSLAYCQMLVDYVAVAMKTPIKKQQRQKGECELPKNNMKNVNSVK